MISANVAPGKEESPHRVAQEPCIRTGRQQDNIGRNHIRSAENREWCVRRRKPLHESDCYRHAGGVSLLALLGARR